MSKSSPRRREYALAFLVVTVVTLASLPLRPVADPSELVMAYLLAVVVIATRTSRGPAAVAAIVSVAVFDFLFVPPYGTFEVADLRYVPVFAVMLIVGLVVGTLTARVRRHAEDVAAATLRARTEEMRSALLSSVSHDLRTPLAAIKGAASALLETQDLDARARGELLFALREESERLERLVSNLLDMTRLESGALHVNKQWVPLEEVVGSALARYDRRLAGRPVSIDVPGDALVPIDDALFENVLGNVVENVCRHTPPGTPLEILARVSTDAATVEIADRGPGLPAGAEERVFEKFWQASPRRSSGSGLGLPICRGIVEAHGGRMTARNREGGGATFRIELPVDGAPPQVPAERREDA